MIFIKVNKNDDPTKAHIMSKMYQPFNPQYGFKKADGTVYVKSESSQLEKDQDGYLVDYTEYTEPKPNTPVGKISNEYFNTTTKEYIFEYVDAPPKNTTSDDTKDILIQLLKDSIE